MWPEVRCLGAHRDGMDLNEALGFLSTGEVLSGDSVSTGLLWLFREKNEGT